MSEGGEASKKIEEDFNLGNNLKMPSVQKGQIYNLKL